MKYKGIDVSETQGDINWSNVEHGKIEFAMVRATYGSSGVDIQFSNNMRGISKTNIYAGVYHDSEAGSVSEAVREANYFLNTVRPYKLLYPVAVNVENEMAMQMGKEFFTSIICAFVQVIKENNYYPLIYGSLEVLESIELDSLSGVGIWLKENVLDASKGPGFKKGVGLWQYSDKGCISGIKGSVNLDFSYFDYPKLIRMQEKNILNLSESGAIYMNENMNTETNMNDGASNGESGYSTTNFYTVQKGDTLQSVAQKILGNSEDYKKLMKLNGLTRPVIFAGQILRIPSDENKETFSYRVVPGDTLWKLAERFLGYGPRYNEIMSDNGLTNDMIYPGQILKIKMENGNNNSSAYIVKKGDTLWKIAQNTLGNGNRYTEIMKLNNLKDGNLTVGQPLIIPSN